MKLSVHHIGGRWGSIPAIAKWATFFPIFDVTLYEPDMGAVEKIRRADLKSVLGYKSVTIQTECLGAQDGTSDFHLCFDRSSSSMLPFNPACSDYTMFLTNKGVYKLGTANTSERIQVSVRSIGSLIAEGKISTPDLLSIDAEGAALHILKGIGDKNLENVLCLIAEASLIPYHHGESFLHETLAFLTARDFFCFDLADSGRLSLAEMHLGAFDRGPISAVQEVLFLKNPAKVDAPDALEKLALLALLCGAVSVAYACFVKLEKFERPQTWPQSPENVGLNCLADFYKTFSAYKDLKLPKYDETMTAEANDHLNYSHDPITAELWNKYTSHIAQVMPKYLYVLAEYKQLENAVPTHDVLFEKYGLTALAAEARTARATQVEFLKDVLARSGLIRRG